MYGQDFVGQAADVFGLGAALFNLAGGTWPRLARVQANRRHAPPVGGGSAQPGQKEQHHAYLQDLLETLGPPEPGLFRHAPQGRSKSSSASGPLSTCSPAMRLLLGHRGFELLRAMLDWNPEARPKATEIAEHAFGRPGSFTLVGLKLPCPWHGDKGPHHLDGIGDRTKLEPIPASGLEEIDGHRHSWNCKGGDLAVEVLDWLRGDPGLQGEGAHFDLSKVEGPAHARTSTLEGCQPATHDYTQWPYRALKKKTTGFAGTGATVGADRKPCNWTKGGQMCGLTVDPKGLPLPRVNAWLEAFLSINEKALEKMFGKARARVARTIRPDNPLREERQDGKFKEAAWNLFWNIPWRTWFLRMAEIHVTLPSIPAECRAPEPALRFGVPGLGAGPEPMWHEPRHNDGAGSVMHMALTLYGERDVVCETTPWSHRTERYDKNNAPPQVREWEANPPADIVLPCRPGSVYCGQLTGPTHQVHHRRSRPEGLLNEKWAVAIMFRTGLFNARSARMRNNLDLHPKELFDVVAESFRKEWADADLRLPPLALIKSFAEETPQAPLKRKGGTASVAPAGTAQKRQPQGVRAATSRRHGSFAVSSFAMSAARSVKRRRRNKSGVGKKLSAAEARHAQAGQGGGETEC